ncbi:unnamed protein product [Bemisia tabaci]|uniref:Peptidase C1A papain C-terminal domain-containing protein n=1 Tax=Bemisia tabaci TaxID=7038 RepID=A0A9P0CBS2_BEMTA|nr:unnamed protein product [Bemisia tabaci]
MKHVITILCLIARLDASPTKFFFLSNAFIEEINSKQDSWEAGRNFGEDVSLVELGLLTGTFMEGRKKELRLVKTFDPKWPERDQIPKNFDARQKWRKMCPRIGEVVDQGRCGSCWAISAAGSFTDRYCIATNGKHQMRLSAANVLSCCHDCGDGCDGGWEHLAWGYFNKHGLPTGGRWNTTEGCQPYNIPSPCKRSYNRHCPYKTCPMYDVTPKCQTRCTNEAYGKTLRKDRHFSGKEYALPKDERAIMKEIMTHGPVTAAFIAMYDFPHYKKGVYMPTEGAAPLGGHAVKVIGWGSHRNKPYWLVMNSWNQYWGDRGVVKMMRNHPSINLEDECWAAIPDLKRRKTCDDEVIWDDIWD